MAKTEEKQRAFKDILGHLKIIDKEHSDFEKSIEDVFDLLLHRSITEMHDILKKVDEEADQMNTVLTELELKLGKFTEASLAFVEQNEKILVILLLSVSLVGLFLSVLILVSVHSSLDRTSAQITLGSGIGIGP